MRDDYIYRFHPPSPSIKLLISVNTEPLSLSLTLCHFITSVLQFLPLLALTLQAIISCEMATLGSLEEAWSWQRGVFHYTNLFWQLVTQSCVTLASTRQRETSTQSLMMHQHHELCSDMPLLQHDLTLEIKLILCPEIMGEGKKIKSNETLLITNRVHYYTWAVQTMQKITFSVNKTSHISINANFQKGLAG